MKNRSGGACLGVEHDGAENTGVLHGGAEVVEGFLVVLVGPMGEVEASHVHARPQKLLDHWDRARCGPQRAHNLRLRLLFRHHPRRHLFSPVYRIVLVG